MSTGKRLAAAALAAGIAVGAPGVALGHDELMTDDGGTKGLQYEHRHIEQHGDGAGHLGATSSGVEVISKLRLKNVEPEKIADVGVSPDGNTAFLAAWGGATCRYNGVHVVDIATPSKPREVAFIEAKEGSAPGEGVQALNLTTPSFNGTLLVTNNEICKDKAGFGGMNLYDVTKPSAPTPLGEGIGDFTVNGQGKKAANEIHSVFAWDAGDKGYAVQVDNEEGKDVDIFDITDPRRAKLVAEYDLDELFPSIRQAAPSNLTEVFLHDMVVKEIGGRQVMLLSYWDAGYVQVDVTNPLRPLLLADTDFANPDREATESGLTVPPEGNGHQGEFTSDNAYVLAADEDFAPYALVSRNDTDGTQLDGGQGSGTKKLEDGRTITGQAVFVGKACAAGSPAVPTGDGTQIAVVERGICSFTEKVASVQAATGYAAVLVFNREGSDGCTDGLTMSVDGTIPAFGVASRPQGYAIFGREAEYDEAACRAGDENVRAPIPVGTTGDTLTFSSYFDGWGYVHVYKNQKGADGKLIETDTYALPQAHDALFASGFGDLSVHEVATSKANSRLAYFSYYSGGLRVGKIDKAGRLVEVGRFIDEGGSNLWGVEVFADNGVEYVAASDRDSGLYVFRATGG